MSHSPRTVGRRAGVCLAGALTLIAPAALTGTAQAASAFSATSAVLDATNTVAPQSTFKQFLTDAQDTGTTRVIVGLQTKFDPAQAASASAVPGLRRRVAAARADVVAAGGSGAKVVRSFDSLPYVAMSLTPAAVRALQASGTVASIQEDQAYKPLLADTTQLIESAPEVTRGYGGSGETIAILDDGIVSAHPFIAGRLVDEACFTSPSISPGFHCPNGTATQTGPGAAEFDAAAHGVYPSHSTSVAGVAAGKREPSGTYDGVAPGANIMPVNVFTASVTYESDWMAGLQYVLDRANAGAPIAAVNMSFGSTTATTGACDTLPAKSIIDALRAKGIPSIISAGNDNASDRVNSPACISSAIAVGATTKADAVVNTYNSSSQIALWAPGWDVITSQADGTGYIGYGTMSGTSFAAPHVAGAWADYVQRYPGTSVNDVLAAFQSTGKPITDPRNGVTRSRINVAASFGRWAFVVSTLASTASYTPSVTLQGNSTGASNSVEHTATGWYTVHFPNIGNPTSANIQVRGWQDSTNRCVPSGSGTSGSTGNVIVRCFTPAGTPVDATFTISIQVNEAKATKTSGYLTTIDGTTSTTPPAKRQANSTGATNTVNRITTGRYSASFPGFTGAVGNPQVTATGTSGNFCQIVPPLSVSSVDVACYSPAGTPADTTFSLSFASQQVYTGRKGGYIYANNATATTAYTPTGDATWNSAGGVNTSRKTATGEYEVVLPGVPGTRVAPQVSATEAGVNPRWCTPYLWSTVGSDAHVTVKCTDAAGTPADARFSLNYATSVV
ncbi:MAG: S8 family serine peptidase [Patulibacter sp.]|nr:S8 family serine peptidase [Patulibacter sp.]